MAQHFITASNVVMMPEVDDSRVEGFHVYTNGTGKVDGMAAINARQYLGYIQLPGNGADYMVAMSAPYGNSDYRATRHASLDDAIAHIVSVVSTIDDSRLDLKYGMPHSWVDSSTYRMNV